MEDVLALYHRPFDPHRPLVCFDEGSKQLVAEVRNPLPPQPGQLARYDFEYRRTGTANMFIFFPVQACGRYNLGSNFKEKRIFLCKT